MPKGLGGGVVGGWEDTDRTQKACFLKISFLSPLIPLPPSPMFPSIKYSFELMSFGFKVQYIPVRIKFHFPDTFYLFIWWSAQLVGS